MKINISVQFVCIVNAGREKLRLYTHVSLLTKEKKKRLDSSLWDHNHTSCQDKHHIAKGSIKQAVLFTPTAVSEGDSYTQSAMDWKWKVLLGTTTAFF